MEILISSSMATHMDVITFSPLYMERVWGGRQLENVYSRKLPMSNTPYGESWEMADRPREQSIVNHGTLTGMTLGELWKNKRAEIFGIHFDNEQHFPLLIKILDARDDLSIQVHPPAEIAGELGGQPKTEIWYIAAAAPDAKIYIGLKKGISKDHFQKAIHQGTVDQLVHTITPRSGDSIFIPSGRLHAIGAGILIYEIQQNSDTTYRVFDWNRMGLDGSPRQLNIRESMRCIDFNDVEPSIVKPDGNTLTDCPFFKVENLKLTAGNRIDNPDSKRFSIVTIISGEIESKDGRTHIAGDSLLMPCNAHPLIAKNNVAILQTTIPQ